MKTLKSKETRAQRNETVTHNSVFAAHRLQCRMTTRKIDIRHFVCLIVMVILIRFDINRNKDTISAANQSEEIST